MPPNPALVARIRPLVADEPGLVEKSMFGGVGFLVRGNMACGTMSDGSLLVRAAPDDSDTLTALPHATLMEQRGKGMRGWITVAAEGYAADADLAAWVTRGVTYARSLPPK